MKAQVTKIAMAMLLVFGVSVAGAATHKAAKVGKPVTPQVRTYTGIVKVTKDKAGQITAVKLSTGKILPRKYNVALDKEGKDLAATMAAQRVQVKGVWEKQSGKKVFVVQEYSLMTSATKAAPKPRKAT